MLPDPNRSRLKIGIVSAMWRRPDLTDIVFSHMAALRREVAPFLDLVPVVAGSEGAASRALAEKRGFGYVEAANAPLGAKWNAALSLLRESDVDGVVVLGSDDLLNTRFFETLHRLVSQGHELVGLDSFFVLDAVNGRLMEWPGYPPPRRGESVGAGRFIGRPLLDRLDWILWEDQRNAGLDASMWKRLTADAARRGRPLAGVVIPCRTEGVILVDVKSDTRMNALEALALSSERIRWITDPAAFLEKHFSPETSRRLFPLPRRTGIVADASGRERNGSAVPDLTIAPLAAFLPKEEDLPPTRVLAPRLSPDAGDFRNHQRLALLSGLIARGRRLEFWTEDPPDTALFKLDSGLRGLPARNLAEAMTDLPPDLEEVVIFDGWSDAALPASVLRRLKKTFPRIRVTLDARFAAGTERERLAPLADRVFPETPGKRVPLLLADQRLPAAPPDLRAHVGVFMEHAGADEDLRELLEARAGEDGRAGRPSLYLAFAALHPDPSPDRGVHACRNENLAIFVRIFRVCILPPRCDNPALAAEILAAGTPLLCSPALAEQMNGNGDGGALPFSRWEEALRLAALLDEKPDLWKKLADRARQTGEELLRRSRAVWTELTA